MSEEVPRGPKGKRRWAMNYIADKTLFKAVMFARTMMRKGETPQASNYRAAQFYGVKTEDVAHYTGQAGGTYRHRFRPRRNNS